MSPRNLGTSHFPTATFTLVGPIDLAKLATAAGTSTVDVNGTLVLRRTLAQRV